MQKIEVGVLGATGMVGQHFLKFLDGHPWFEVTWLGASERSAGKRYSDVATWHLAGGIPESIAGLTVEECKPGCGPRLVFSAMDASVAGEIEEEFARGGHVVVSNSRNHRMDPDVPLLVPEINPDHLQLIPLQQRNRGWKGMIATNPNCSTVGLTMALAPLKPFGIRKVITTTLQAISGAGYPGVASMDIVGNVIPHIGGEEEKMEQETQKILGDYVSGQIRPLPAVVSAHCNRVPVVDGHTVTASVEFSSKPALAEVQQAFDRFTSVPQERRLPSAPPKPVVLLREQNRPQPRKDAARDRGMTVFVGRLRECPVLDYKMVALSHNTIRGAAAGPPAGASGCGPEGPTSKLLLGAMLVMKFGGTSVESASAIQRVARIVRDQLDRRPVVVVSAMGKTTNKLLAIARSAVEGRKKEAIQAIHELRDFHSREARQVVPLADRTELDVFLDEHFQELTELIKGLSVLGEATPRSIDAISSYGERLSSYIVSRALTHFGMPSVHLDSRCYLITDGRFNQATPLYNVTYPRLADAIPPLLSSGRVVVLGGFIGATESGVTTTLGRGGSDFSASIIGAGIGAEEIQIWTDVDGMLTADPTILPGGRRVKVISFSEAAELAYFGAKVLHPSTLLPAMNRNIPVRILNSRRPECEGTKIIAQAPASSSLAKSIACKKNLTVVDISSTRMLMAHGFLHRIFEIFDRYETPVDMVTTSEVSVSLTIDNTDRLREITRDLSQFAEVSHENRQAIICVVGDNIRYTPGVAGRIFKAVEHVNVRMISQGASLRNVSFLVQESDLKPAVEALHAAFFSELDPEIFE